MRINCLDVEDAVAELAGHFWRHRTNISHKDSRYQQPYTVIYYLTT